MMRRLALLALVSLLISGISIGLTAQPQDAEVLDGRELEGLYLISDQTKPEWGDGWTAPIEAATILGWFRMKGYTTLLGDWDNNGVVDVLDAIELADYFGRSPMQSDSEDGTSDARLIDTLARYVAERSPEEFEILIFDEGFPAEYEDEFPGAFDADMVPKIQLTLEAEPSFEAYAEAILSGLGVIVGIAEEDGVNYYLGGRSFLFEPVGDGMNAMDFAWAKEDLWRAGTQGQVLPTVATSRSALHIEFVGDWREVEFMAVLAPIDRPRVSEAGACAGPDLRVALADMSCRCEATEGDLLSCYSEAFFVVSNDGDEDAPECEVTVGGIDWSETLRQPTRAGGSGILWIAQAFVAAEPPCPEIYYMEADPADRIDECEEGNNRAEGSVCCSGSPAGGCPDLAIELVRAWCECPDEAFAGDCAETETPCRAHFEVTVTNIGDAASGPFGIWGTDYPDGLAPGEAVLHFETFDHTMCHTETEEHLAYMPVLTGSAYLDEDSPDDCDLSNNALDIPFTCEPLPCFDLAISIDDVICDCESSDEELDVGTGFGEALACTYDVTVTVSNVSEVDSDAFQIAVGGYSPLGHQDVSGLAGGASATYTFTREVIGAADLLLDRPVSAYAWHPESYAGEHLNDCNLANNSAEVPPPCAAPEAAGCPDLVGEITRVRADCEGGEPIHERRIIGWNNSTMPPTPIYGDVLVGYTPYECELQVTVQVTNAGTAAAPSSQLTIYDRSHGVEEVVSVIGLAPGETMSDRIELVYETEECDRGFIDVDLVVDSGDEIVECVGGESNNTDEETESVECE